MQPDPRLVALLSDAHKILVFTGAGISTSSGIRDYRGPRGIWKTRQTVCHQGFRRSGQARLEY